MPIGKITLELTDEEAKYLYWNLPYTNPTPDSDIYPGQYEGLRIGRKIVKAYEDIGFGKFIWEGLLPKYQYVCDLCVSRGQYESP